MRKRAFRSAVTAAVICVSAFLLACPVGQLRMQIPDFFTSEVKGVRLYRIDDASGQLVDAGTIEFLKLEKRKDGELLKYEHVSTTGEVTGPLYTQAARIPTLPDGLEINLSFSNELPAGWFKVASYNLIGTSRPSTNQTFVVGAEG